MVVGSPWTGYVREIRGIIILCSKKNATRKRADGKEDGRRDCGCDKTRYADDGNLYGSPGIYILRRVTGELSAIITCAAAPIKSDGRPCAGPVAYSVRCSGGRVREIARHLHKFIA